MTRSKNGFCELFLSVAFFAPYKLYLFQLDFRILLCLIWASYLLCFFVLKESELIVFNFKNYESFVIDCRSDKIPSAIDVLFLWFLLSQKKIFPFTLNFIFWMQTKLWLIFDTKYMLFIFSNDVISLNRFCVLLLFWISFKLVYFNCKIDFLFCNM